VIRTDRLAARGTRALSETGGYGILTTSKRHRTPGSAHAIPNEREERTLMGVRQALAILRDSDTWLGVLDVLVVAYLIYRLLLLARGTRALQILGGLGTLLLALLL